MVLYNCTHNFKKNVSFSDKKQYVIVTSHHQPSPLYMCNNLINCFIFIIKWFHLSVSCLMHNNTKHSNEWSLNVVSCHFDYFLSLLHSIYLFLSPSLLSVSINFSFVLLMSSTVDLFFGCELCIVYICSCNEHQLGKPFIRICLIQFCVLLMKLTLFVFVSEHLDLNEVLSFS